MKVVVAAADLHAPIGYAAQPGITLERRDKPGDVLVPFGLRAVLAAILDEKLFHCCVPWLSDNAGGHQSPRTGARAEDRTLKPQDFFARNSAECRFAKSAKVVGLTPNFSWVLWSTRDCGQRTRSAVCSSRASACSGAIPVANSARRLSSRVR